MHAAVIARLDELLAANQDRSLYLAEICAATGVSERTLRAPASRGSPFALLAAGLLRRRRL
jgi:hypothetical protein